MEALWIKIILYFSIFIFPIIIKSIHIYLTVWLVYFYVKLLNF